MTFKISLAILAAFCLWSLTEGKHVVKRESDDNLPLFRRMQKCASEEDAFAKFFNYGCYCLSIPNSDQDPADKIDECCRNRNKAIRELDNSIYYCTYANTQYSSQCVNQENICSNNAAGSCESKACNIDKAAVACFVENRLEYNEAHKSYDEDGMC